MKKFIFQGILFLLISVAIGEGVVRMFYLTSDAPRTYMGKDNLIKYYPNQEGTYKGNTHKWKINKYGFSGNAPQSLDKLILIMGDSYIENLMNPVNCHQNSYLQKFLPQYNYFQASRQGASVMELMEISKSLDTLRPMLEVLYIKDNDLYESMASRNQNARNVRLDVATGRVKYGKLQASALKDIMRNFKLAYYLYTNYYLGSDAEQNKKSKDVEASLPDIKKVVEFMKQHYNTSNKIFVFSPDSNEKIIALFNAGGLKAYQLKSDNYQSWLLDYDPHWSCYGHEQAALQVKSFIEQSLKH